jgi:hypothetical protein
MHCPHCGKPIQINMVEPNGLTYQPAPWMFGFEYRSKQQLFGVPLLHVAVGYSPRTGLPRLARGIIAIGNFALGVVAIGGIAAGGIVLSGIGFGVLVIAGIAVGWVAIGGLAVGIAFALGGLAVSVYHAIGGLPLLLNGMTTILNNN